MGKQYTKAALATLLTVLQTGPRRDQYQRIYTRQLDDGSFQVVGERVVTVSGKASTLALDVLAH